MDLSGQKVLVVGLGASGLAATRLLIKQGASVTVNDLRSEADLGAAVAEVRAAGATVELGAHGEALFTSVDRIVVSPGVPPLAALDAAERAGIPVASEVELASWFVQGTVVAVTGTNGKSTVTSMLGEMCSRTGRPTFVGGNLGTPLVDVVDTAAACEGGIVVVELSSFQLERVDRFHADVAVLLNVSADHLDRYPSFEAYAHAKAGVFHGQGAADAAVIPAGDELCSELAAGSGAEVYRFGGSDGAVRVHGAAIVNGASALHVPVADLRLRGAHNRLNACAAALAARLVGVSPLDVAAVLREFSGLEHRMQHVRRLDDVDYYDDSKATNVGAAVAAIDGVDPGARVVLIAGGKDKGGSYAALGERLAARGRAAVLLGEAQDRIAECLPKGFVVVRAESMYDAVERATGLALPGDAVVLAPACSSYDMFRSYVERGRAFQRAVLGLTEGA